MREIKFRAWDPLVHEHYYGYDCFTPVPTGYCSLTVEQFTCSQDINGVEIYEGDLMECNHKCLWQVSFNCKIGCFVAHNPVDIEDCCFLDDWDYEIIGNIHQDANLLNER